MKLNIWHKENHEDGTVTVVKAEDPKVWVADAIFHGGFWHGDVFTPWHSVTHIEPVD